MKKIVLFLSILSTWSLFAQTGPGGVGTSANNVIWLDANRGITLSGTSVTNWADQSGNGFNAIPPSNSARPIITNNSVNGYPSVKFDGTDDEFRVTDNAKLDLTQWHMFVVPIADVAKDFNAWLVKGDDIFENYEILSYANNNIHVPILYTDNNRTFVESAGGQVSTSAFNIIEYTYLNTVGRDVYKNFSNIYTDNENRTPKVNAMDLYIGNEKATAGRFVNGKMAEILMYNAPLNSAQRIIVNNYLAAKYNVSLSSSDIYVQDNAGNGNYDHEVAGIGRVDASNIHNDAQGSGIVRILNPAGLGDNEFLIWGHDNASLTFNQYTDIPSGMHARTNRVWRVSEVNASGTAVDVGAIDIRFNLTGLGNFKTADLRLLIDTDNDGVFTDETGISGATSLGNGIYAFTGVTGITNNARFTICRRFVPDLFIKANVGVTNFGTTVSQWNDYSGKNNHVTQTVAADRPSSDTTNLINFNPAIQFAAADFMNSDSNAITSGTTERSFYAVAYPNSTTAQNAVVCQGTTSNYFETYLSNGNIGFGISNSKIANFPYTHSLTTAPKLGRWSLNDNTTFNGVNVFVNGLQIANTSADATSINNPKNITFIGSTTNGNTKFSNLMCEVIHYPFTLTSTENSLIQSYLAIKWGITLSQSASTNHYINSSFVRVWDASIGNAANCKQRIAGIGRDDAMALYQKQSQSQEDISTNTVVTMGIGSIAVSNSNNANTMNDGSFLIWADDSADLVEQTSEMPTAINGGSTCGQGKRLAREWMIQRTGTVPSVQIRMNINNLGINGRPLNRFKLVISNSKNFTSATTFVNASSFTSGVLTFNNVTFSDTDAYFTLITDTTMNYGPGGVVIGLTSWFRSDNKTTGVITSGTGTLADETGSYTLTRNAGGNVVVFNGDSSNFNYNKYLFFQTNGFLSRSGLNENDVFLSTQGTAYSVGLIPTSNFVANVAASSRFNGIITAANFNNTASNFGTSVTTRPNIFGMISTSTTNVTSYTNGLTGAASAAPGPRSGGVYTLYMGNNGAAAPVYNNSNIGEAFSFSRALSATERNRVESYLAFKFGVTLSQSVVTNYVASNGSVVWNATTNTGYNYNVAAIIRDDCSQLNQKQSRSMNNTNRYHNMLAIGLGTLASYNNVNTNTFSSNLDFIAWGDDSLVGTKTTEIPTALNPSGCQVVRRLSKEWKVQTSGMTDAVYMRFYLSGIVNSATKSSSIILLIDNDNNFSNGGTTIVNATAYDTANMVADFSGITLTNGSYFTLVTDIYSAAPGNVSTNLRMWLRADRGINLATGVNQWEDQSAAGNNAIQNTAGNQPAYKNNTTDNINFNPVLDFTAASSHRMTFPTTTLSAGTGDFAVYTVTRRRSATQGSIFAFGTASAHTGFYAGYNASTQHMFNTTTGTYYPNTGISPYYMPYITKYARYGSNKRRINTNGRQTGIDSSVTINIAQSVATIGSSLSGTYFFEGEIAELIVYQTDPSGTNESKIQSYLAVKYGLTLDQTTATNYVASNGTVVWNATTNAAYRTRVFGIANDLCSGLTQKQSRSILDTNGIFTVSLNSMAASNAANTGTFSNDSIYIMLGDNNAAMTETNADLPSTTSSCSKRLAREWKADITGTSTAVELRFDLNTISVSGSAAADFKLMVDNDGDGNYTTGSVTYVNATSYAGKILTFSNVILGDGKVYTIITKDQAVGTVNLTPANTELTTSTSCSKNGWVTIYDPADSSKRLFAVYPNGNTFTPMNIKINTGFGFTTADLNKADRLANKAITLMQRMVQVFDATGGNDTINGGMIVRFYYDPAEKTDAQNRMTQLRADSSITGNTSWNWFKSEKTIPEIISQMTGAGIGGPSRVWITNPDSAGTEDGVTFAEFRNITEFSTFGGGQISGGNWNILPVKLLDFKATKRNTEAVLDWSTASEKNASHFVIERSSDAKTWNAIGSVKANGNTASVSKYQFVDAAPLNGMNYYRLNTVDFDLTFELSKIVGVDFTGESNNNIKVYPNPVVEFFTIESTNKQSQELEVSIFNQLGETIFTEVLNFGQGENLKVIQKSSNMTSGVYLLKVLDRSIGLIETKQIIIK